MVKKIKLPLIIGFASIVLCGIGVTLAKRKKTGIFVEKVMDFESVLIDLVDRAESLDLRLSFFEGVLEIRMSFSYSGKLALTQKGVVLIENLITSALKAGIKIDCPHKGLITIKLDEIENQEVLKNV